MRSINIREARKRLSELLRAAEQGESILLTRRGKDVARIVTAGGKPCRGLPDLDAFRKSLKVKGRSLTDELLAMRREEQP